ncbi:MAG: CoA transferase [Pseudomonadota bacterium]
MSLPSDQNQNRSPAKGALEGIRILDFTQMMLGPLCTQTLADLGADVIKVERPGSGDWIRAMPMAGSLVEGDSAAFHAFNRNKRSLAVDLKNPQGREALLALATHCDVVVENFRSGVMDRLGLGYEDFKTHHPTIIYASGSGWGSQSARAKEGMPGQDLLIQAMSGVMFNTGRAADPPTPCGTPVADFAASQSLAIGILSALLARNRHGVGQKIETNLYAATLNMMAQENFAVLNQGLNLQRTASGLASCWNDAPYGVFQTRDGWVAIAMCPLDKLGDLIGDRTLADLDAWRQRDEAKQRTQVCIRKKTTDAWMTIFKDADVWAAPVRTARQAMDELVADEALLVEVDHPKAGPVKAVACPITMSETPARVRHGIPAVGADTRDILTEFLGPEQVAHLHKAGAIS